MNLYMFIPSLIGVVSTLAVLNAIRLILLSRSAVNLSAIALLFTMVISLMGYHFQLVIPYLPLVLFWQKIQIFGINFMYPAWLVFVMFVTGNQKYLRWPLLVVLIVLSIIPNIVLNTPILSNWFVTTKGLIPAGPFHVLDQEIGWVVWFSTSIATFQGIVGSVVLFKQRRNLRKFYQPQFLLLLLLPIIPFISIWVEISGNNPVAPISLFNLSIIPVCLITTFTIYSLRVGEDHNRLKENAVDSIHAAIIILDSRDRIEYANTAACEILGKRLNDNKKQPLTQVSAEISETLSRMKSQPDGPNLITLGDFVFGLKIKNTFDWRGETVTKMIVMTNITDNDQLEKKIFDQNREISHTNALLSALAEVNLFIQSTNNLNQMFEVLDKVMRNFGFSYFILTIDPGSNDLVINFLSSRDNILDQVEKSLGSRVSGYRIKENAFPELFNFLHSRTPERWMTPKMLLKDSTLHPAIRESIRLLTTDPNESLFMLKLRTGEKLIGILGILGNTLEEKIISTFRIFASQMAYAIERNRAYEEELDRANELTKSNQLITALVRVTTLMGSSGDYNTSLDTLGAEIEQLNLHCVLGTLDPTSESITFQYTSFSPKLIRSVSRLTKVKLKGYKIPQNKWPGTQVIGQGISVWYTNIPEIIQKMFPEIPDTVFNKIMKSLNITAEQNLCILPLINNGKVVGVLPVWGEGISEKDTSTLTVFAFQVGQILERMKAYEEEQNRSAMLIKSNNILIALSKVASRLETRTDIKEIYQTLGNELKNVEIECMVGMIDEKKESMTMEYLSISQFIIEFSRSRNINWQTQIRIPRSLWPTDKVVVTKEPYWDDNPIESVFKMFPFIPKQIMTESFKAIGMQDRVQMCYLPIIVNDDVAGILGVWGPNLHIADLPGLSVFANQVSTSIQNSKLYEQAQNEIIIRTEAEKKIQEALTEKEVLLKEVHHRVKNNLQIISSLLNLQIGQSTDPILLDALRESQSRVRAMALIHEKLYQSEDLSRIDMTSYISGLTNALVSTYRVAPEKALIKIETADIYLDLETAIPCGLIINELISNSLKYAFPEDKSGTIHVSFHEPKQGEYRLIVKDNGIGLPENFSVEKGSSLGLKLVSGLVRQIEGEMKVKNEAGVKFEIHFSSNGAID